MLDFGSKRDEYVDKIRRNYQLKVLEIRRWRKYKRILDKTKWEQDINIETYQLFTIRPVDIYKNIRMFHRRDQLFRLKLTFYTTLEEPKTPEREEKLRVINFDIEHFCNEHRNDLRLSDTG